MPTKTSSAPSAAARSRASWPAWKGSKVPPRQTRIAGAPGRAWLKASRFTRTSAIGGVQLGHARPVEGQRRGVRRRDDGGEALLEAGPPAGDLVHVVDGGRASLDRKSTRLNSSHG